MNRAEKKAKEKAKRRAAKLARFRREGGKSRYARKAAWRVKNLEGAPIPTVYGTASFEEARRLYHLGIGVEVA